MARSPEHMREHLQRTEQHTPPWLQAELQNLLNIATLYTYGPEREVRDPSTGQMKKVRPGVPWVGYQQPRVAPVSPFTLEAQQLTTEQRNKDIESFLNQAKLAARLGMKEFPKEYKKYINPYMKEVTDRIAEEGNRNFNENILPALEAKFVRLGTHGSKRHADMARRAAREVQGEVSAQQAKALASGYTQALQSFQSDQLKQLEGARTLGAISQLQKSMRQADIESIRRFGQEEQARSQRQLDIDFDEWRRMRQEPYERLTWLASILHGTPYSPATYSWTTPGGGGGAEQPGLFQQLGGLAFAGAPLIKEWMGSRKAPWTNPDLGSFGFMSRGATLKRGGSISPLKISGVQLAKFRGLNPPKKIKLKTPKIHVPKTHLPRLPKPGGR